MANTDTSSSTRTGRTETRAEAQRRAEQIVKGIAAGADGGRPFGHRTMRELGKVRDRD